MKKIFSLLIAITCFMTSLFAWENATMLRENGTLWRKNKSGEMYWENNVSRSVATGTVLQINKDAKLKADLLSSSGRSSQLTFYPAKYDNQDYFVLADHVAMGSTLAVLYQDAVLYTHPKLSEFRNAILEAGTIAVTKNSINQNGVEFMEIQFFDTQAWRVKTRYIQASKISNFPNDIQAARLIEKAQASTNESIKRELISNAIDLETTEPMKALIQKEYQKIFAGEQETQSTKSIISLPDTKMIIISPDGENVYVRTEPDSKSNITSQIADSSIVLATQKTKEKEMIEDEEENWFFIANENASGWIFGSYLAPYSGTEETANEVYGPEEILY